MQPGFSAILLPMLVQLAASAAEPQWPVVLPMTLEKNLPLVRIGVNGVGMLTFILDSAADGCVLDGECAAALGLKPAETGWSSGSGGMQQVGILRSLRLDVGGVLIPVAIASTVNMKELLFQQAQGVLGFPLFGRYVVEIDYPGSRVRIFRPESYRPPHGAQVVPMRMTTGPVVQGSVRVRGRAPIEADMQLDTGSAHVVTFCTPFADRHRLLDAADEVAAGRTRGIGGDSPDMTGRIEEVRIGRFAVEKPLVRFSRQTTGSFGSEQHYSANIGGGFMKHCRVTFDIPHSRLVLQ
jgi:hypothetical protein